MTTATLLCAALVLDAVLGEPRWLWDRLPHPAVVMGRAIQWLDGLLNTGTNKQAKGALTLVLLVLGAGVLGYVLSLFGALVTIILAAILLAQRSLVDHVLAVSQGLKLSLGEGRRAVAMIVSRDTRAMNESDTSRAAIESAAENFSDGVIAPAFWFLVAGLPGLLIYKTVNTADSMIGYRTDKYEDFGKAAARFDDLLNLIPARLSALLLSAIGGARPSLTAIRSDAGLHRSPNAGWPEAAVARSLDIALAGPRSYDGVTRDFPWVNPQGRKKLSANDVDATVSMLWKAWAAFLVLLILTALIFEGF